VSINTERAHRLQRLLSTAAFPIICNLSLKLPKFLTNIWALCSIDWIRHYAESWHARFPMGTLKGIPEEIYFAVFFFLSSHVKKEAKNSETDSFRHMEIEIKIYYTREDVHVGRNM
jgi:hypothetical protein